LLVGFFKKTKERSNSKKRRKHRKKKKKPKKKKKATPGETGKLRSKVCSLDREEKRRELTAQTGLSSHGGTGKIPKKEEVGQTRETWVFDEANSEERKHNKSGLRRGVQPAKEGKILACMGA